MGPEVVRLNNVKFSSAPALWQVGRNEHCQCICHVLRAQGGLREPSQRALPNVAVTQPMERGCHWRAAALPLPLLPHFLSDL